MKNDLGDVVLAVNDTSHNLKSIANTFLELSNKMTDVHEMLPDMAHNVEMLVKSTVSIDLPNIQAAVADC
jgi:hypothetical protein